MANDSPLDQLVRNLANFWSPPKGAPPKQSYSDAPGANARIDLSTPDGAGDPGVPYSRAHSDSSGFVQHGYGPTPRDIAETQATLVRERSRYPGLATHGPANPIPPRYNVFYDGLRSDVGYDKVIYNTAHGAWIVGTTTIQPVVLDFPANLRLAQFPGGVMVFPVIMLISFGQSAAATSGEYSFGFTPDGGEFTIPLGEFNATTLDKWEQVRWIVPSAITDPQKTFLGNLVITSNAVVGTPTIFWRLGFGWAYQIPMPAWREGIQRPELAHIGTAIEDAPLEVVP